MTEPIIPVTGIGPSDVVREQPGRLDGAQEWPRVVPGGRRPSERGTDVPSLTVDLSLDPQAVRRLPPDVYLRYFVRPGVGNYVVQVIDRRTGDVIREIPPGGLELALQEFSRQRASEQ